MSTTELNSDNNFTEYLDFYGTDSDDDEDLGACPFYDDIDREGLITATLWIRDARGNCRHALDRIVKHCRVRGEMNHGFITVYG